MMPIEVDCWASHHVDERHGLVKDMFCLMLDIACKYKTWFGEGYVFLMKDIACE